MIYIQILRAIAAVGVVIFHCVGTAHHYSSDMESAIFLPFYRGDVGVDLFFLISGFIIYYSTHKNKFGSGDFLARRLKRIIPMYWIATLLFVALIYLVPSAFKGGVLEARHILTSLVFTSVPTGNMPIVYVGWSIEYEMLFYIIVALILLCSERVWDLVAIGLSALVVVGFLTSRSDQYSPLGFVTNPRLLEFVYGVLAAQLFRHVPFP